MLRAAAGVVPDSRGGEALGGDHGGGALRGGAGDYCRAHRGARNCSARGQRLGSAAVSSEKDLSSLLDEKAFSRKCNAATEPLYLYGNSDGSWELRPLKLLMPPGQPDPRMFGVKLVRGDMKSTKWLVHIAMHCDAWLIRISFFLGANLGTQERQRLSTMINSLQTVREAFVASDTYRRICRLEKMNVEIDDEDEGCGTEPTICAKLW
ncbi:unnamed protein product [Urochloa humidicola]